MQLEPLYQIRFTYPEGWKVDLGSGWQQHFYIAEGRCEGTINGRFRGANFPRMRADETFLPDFRAALETDDGATIMFEWRGYGWEPPVGRLVGAVFHSSDDTRYQRLNDVICVCTGEVRPAAGGSTDLIIDIAELLWEPVAD